MNDNYNIITMSTDFLSDLKNIYNIDGAALMRHYNVSKILVTIDGFADPIFCEDRVTITTNLSGKVFAIEKK